MLSILHRLIFGLLSGVTEFLPVGAQPHQNIYAYITKFNDNDPWLKFYVLLGAFIALMVSLRHQFYDIHQAKKSYRYSQRRKQRGSCPMGVQTARLYKIAMIPMLISAVFYGVAQNIGTYFPGLIMLLLLNGFFLILPRVLPSGNKDGRTMTGVDAIFMGIGAALGVIPGLSRIGVGCAMGEAKGGKASYVLEIVLLATVWPLAVIMLFTLFGAMTSMTSVGWDMILADMGAALMSFAGAWFGIRAVRWISSKYSLYKFAFYSWTFSLLLFILYMFVV